MKKLDVSSFNKIETPLCYSGAEKAIGDILRCSHLKELRAYQSGESEHNERVVEFWGDLYCILNEILNDGQ